MKKRPSPKKSPCPYGCQYWCTQVFLESTSESAKVPERKEIFINMVDTCEIEYIRVPNTKGESDLLKHFSLRKRKTDGRIDAGAAVCNFIVNSEIALSNFREAPQTRQRIGKRHHPLLMLFVVVFCLLSFFLYFLGLVVGVFGDGRWFLLARFVTLQHFRKKDPPH